jgi:ferredoxin-NADP reductase
LTNGYIQAGIVSFSALTLVGLTSIGPIRRRFFEAFYYPHFLFLVFLIAAIVHASPAPEFLLPGFGLWAADRAWRFFKTLQPIAIKSANIYPGDLLKLQVEGVQPSRPNQIAWLGTSATSYLNGHPYTIASAPGSGTGTFAIRGLGGHTRKLHSLVSGTKEVDASGMTVVGHSLRLRVDGPHGHGSLQWEQYPVVVLLAGGVGITPSISIASYILRGASTPSVSVTTKHIHLMWSVRDLRHTSWFEDELSALSGLAGSGTSGVTFDVSICVSGSSVARVPAQSVYEQSYAMEEPHTYKGPGVVHKGRPDIRHWFTYIKAAHPESDVAVSLCGPRALIADGRRAAVKVSDKGGLFHVEEEVFER